MNFEQDFKGARNALGLRWAMHCPSFRAFVAQIAKRFTWEDSTIIDEDGRFFLKINLSPQEMAFAMLNFGSEEEFTKAFMNQVVEDKKNK